MPPPLPQIETKRLALHVTPAAERALRDGHPWLFDGAIQKQNTDGQAGDLAVIFDRKNRFLAVGLYDPASPIRVRILQHTTPAQIDGDWFHAKLTAATALRAPLAITQTTGYRLVHGENDGLPGVIIDRYANTLVIKLYTAAWLPHLRTLLPALEAAHPAGRWVLRLNREIGRGDTHDLRDGQTLLGTAPDAPIQFLENGLTFAADVVSGHKTGFFFDQRDNRARVGRLARGKTVLDLFAYSGGFSVYAAAGGAQSVLSVDVSAPALTAAGANMALNSDTPAVQAAKHNLRAADVFETLRDLRSQRQSFDLVVVDPPSFAKSAAEVPRALASYADLAKLALPLVRNGGLLAFASCSSRVSAEDFFNTLHTAAQTARRPLKEIERTGHALDHPVTFPEGAYLKCLFAEAG